LSSEDQVLPGRRELRVLALVQVDSLDVATGKPSEFESFVTTIAGAETTLVLAALNVEDTLFGPDVIMASLSDTRARHSEGGGEVEWMKIQKGVRWDQSQTSSTGKPKAPGKRREDTQNAPYIYLEGPLV